ncbi:MAG: hypothetical protein M1816_005428 [Peltula sp. TS41687]|nr:MAG: hypothetical protein M1816_005428 [Peltula sp. TS41687]
MLSPMDVDLPEVPVQSFAAIERPDVEMMDVDRLTKDYSWVEEDSGPLVTGIGDIYVPFAQIRLPRLQSSKPPKSTRIPWTLHPNYRHHRREFSQPRGLPPRDRNYPLPLTPEESARSVSQRANIARARNAYFEGIRFSPGREGSAYQDQVPSLRASTPFVRSELTPAEMKRLVIDRDPNRPNPYFGVLNPRTPAAAIRAPPIVRPETPTLPLPPGAYPLSPRSRRRRDALFYTPLNALQRKRRHDEIDQENEAREPERTRISRFKRRCVWAFRAVVDLVTRITQPEATPEVAQLVDPSVAVPASEQATAGAIVVGGQQAQGHTTQQAQAEEVQHEDESREIQDVQQVAIQAVHEVDPQVVQHVGTQEVHEVVPQVVQQASEEVQRDGSQDAQEGERQVVPHQGGTESSQQGHPQEADQQIPLPSFPADRPLQAENYRPESRFMIEMLLKIQAEMNKTALLEEARRMEKEEGERRRAARIAEKQQRAAERRAARRVEQEEPRSMEIEFARVLAEQDVEQSVNVMINQDVMVAGQVAEEGVKPKTEQKVVFVEEVAEPAVKATTEPDVMFTGEFVAEQAVNIMTEPDVVVVGEIADQGDKLMTEPEVVILEELADQGVQMVTEVETEPEVVILEDFADQGVQMVTDVAVKQSAVEALTQPGSEQSVAEVLPLPGAEQSAVEALTQPGSEQSVAEVLLLPGAEQSVVEALPQPVVQPTVTTIMDQDAVQIVDAVMEDAADHNIKPIAELEGNGSSQTHLEMVTQQVTEPVEELAANLSVSVVFAEGCDTGSYDLKVISPESRRLLQVEVKKEKRRLAAAAKKKAKQEAEARAKTEKAERARKEAEKQALAAQNRRKKPVERVITELSPEWDEKIDQAMKNHPQKELAWTSAGQSLKKKDFDSLVPREGSSDAPWLNDEIINAYIAMIVDYGLDKAHAKQNGGQRTARVRDKEATPKFHAFNSFFYSNLRTKGPESVSRWLKRNNMGGKKLLDVEHIFIPINQSSHWTLIVLSPSARRIEYFDSLGGSKTQFVSQIKALLKYELKGDYQDKDWLVDNTKSPVQRNGYDCGVFTVTTAKMIMLGIDPMAYSQSDIPMQRRRMMAEMMNGGFHGEFAPNLGD